MFFTRTKKNYTTEIFLMLTSFLTRNEHHGFIFDDSCSHRSVFKDQKPTSKTVRHIHHRTWSMKEGYELEWRVFSHLAVAIFTRPMRNFFRKNFSIVPNGPVTPVVSSIKIFFSKKSICRPFFVKFRVEEKPFTEIQRHEIAADRFFQVRNHAATFNNHSAAADRVRLSVVPVPSRIDKEKPAEYLQAMTISWTYYVSHCTLSSFYRYDMRSRRKFFSSDSSHHNARNNSSSLEAYQAAPLYRLSCDVEIPLR